MKHFLRFAMGFGLAFNLAACDAPEDDGGDEADAYASSGEASDEVDEAPATTPAEGEAADEEADRQWSPDAFYGPAAAPEEALTGVTCPAFTDCCEPLANGKCLNRAFCIPSRNFPQRCP